MCLCYAFMLTSDYFCDFESQIDLKGFGLVNELSVIVGYSMICVRFEEFLYVVNTGIVE